MSQKNLVSARFPKIMADLLHSNQFLKMFSIYALILSIITASALIFLVTRDPIVITLDSEARELSKGKPSLEKMVKECVKSYLEVRYNWTPQNIKNNLSKAELFIHQNAMKSYRGSISKVVKFGVERNVSQSLYTDNIVIDLSRKVAIIYGSRITAIQGLRAVGAFKLELSYESGTHSQTNPWGVYITQEKEG
jgi:hypothetical protein